MKRSRLIDTIKGAGIFLVILGHISYTPEALRLWLYSFHMPLFFICSGLTFSLGSNISFLSFLKAKVKSIVIPYFSLGTILWLLSNALLSVISLYQGRGTISWGVGYFFLSMLLGYRLHEYYFSMWFLCVLFFSVIIFYYIERMAKKRSLVYLITSVVCIFCQWCVFRYINGWYLSLDLVPTGIAFISLGRWFRLVDEKYNKAFRKAWLLPIAFLGSILTFYSNVKLAGVTDLYYCMIGDPVLFLAAAFFGSWFVIILLSNIGELKVIEYYGKNSLITYIFQGSFSIPIAAIVAGVAGKHFKLLSDPIIQWLMIIIITFGLSAMLIETINRLFPWMLGKSKKSIRKIHSAE